MSPELRRRMQISLVVLLLLRPPGGLHFYERKSAATARPRRRQPASTSDEYVYPRSSMLRPCLAKALVASQMVKQGYGNLVYPAASSGRRSLSRKASLFLSKAEDLRCRRQAPVALGCAAR